MTKLDLTFPRVAKQWCQIRLSARRLPVLLVAALVALAVATATSARSTSPEGARSATKQRLSDRGVFTPPDQRRRFARASSDVTGTITPGGSPVTVTISNAGDNAAITFSGTANQRVSLNLTAVSISFSYVSIRKPDGSDLVSARAVFTTGKFIDTVTLPTTGTYTIYIDPSGTATGSMTLTLYDVPADQSGTITAGGASVTASVGTPGQNSAITFTANAGDRISLNATNITLNTGYEIISVKSPSGSTLAGSGATSSHYFFDTLTLATTGTYTIYVDPQDSATGTTVLTLYSVPADVLGKTAVRATRSATVSVPGHNPTFTFTGAANEPVQVSITGSTVLYSKISIQKPLGTKLIETSVFTGSSTVGPLNLPSQGTYYLVVDPMQEDTGSMTLKLPRSTAWLPYAQTRGAWTGRGVHAAAPIGYLAEPVNTLTGAYTDSAVDLSVPGKGLPFSFGRTYSSDDTTVGRLGKGWTDSYSASLAIQQNGDVTLHGEDGQQVRYAVLDDGSFVGDAGSTSTLSAVTGGYQLVTRDQVTYRFDSQGKLTSLTDENGNVTTLAYDQSARLATITDSAGHTASFTSNGDGTIASVTVPDGRTVSYGYTSGLLTTVTDPASHTTTYHYDANGRLDQMTDSNGHTVLQNTYGSDGRVTQQTDALAHTTTFSWDSGTQTETVTDARGNVWKDVYSNNVLLKRIDPSGSTTQFGTDVDLDTTSLTAPDGSQTTMTYDSRGNQTSATAPASLNAQKSYTWDANNNLSSITDARNKVSTFSYDSAGNRTGVVQDGTTIAQYTYTAAGQVATAVDGRGNTTTYTYDSAGNLASVTDPAGGKTTYGYDSAGRVTSRVLPRGNVQGANPDDYKWTYTYDAAGHLLTQTDPLGHTTTYTYDAAGNQLTATDAANHTTTYTYDAAGHLATVTAPDGGVTAYTYDAVGDELTETDPRNNTTTNTYTATNLLASVTTPLGEKTTYSYDASGNLTKVVDPRGNVSGANPDDYATTYAYDAAGRLTSQTDPLGHTTTYAYDKTGNRTSVTDANGHATSFAYDGLNRLVSVTAPGGATTSYTYDAASNLLTRTDANNHATSFTYDAANRRTSKTLPLGRTWTYSYNADGDVLSVVDANGNATQTAGDGTTSYGYDRAGRMTSIDYSDSTPDVTFSYDAVGHRTALTDGAGTVTYAYDAAGRLASDTRGSDVFSYTYDALGDVTRRTYPDGTAIDYAYDADGRLYSVTGPGQTTYAYDPAGNLVMTTLPSGNDYSEQRTYDRAGRLVEVKSVRAGSALSDFTYTLDSVGNPTQVVRAGAISGTEALTYDARDRLTEACFQSSCPGGSDPFIRWTYDAVGNRLTEARPSGTTSYTYNAADELTGAGSTSYTYDSNGNELSAGSRSFSYDLENRLASTTSGSTTTSYTYDGLGRRLSASTGAGAAQTTRFLWDESTSVPQLALERDGAGALLRRFTYGARRISMTSGGSAYYYLYDGFGSTANLTSASGATEWTYDYEPFGATRVQTQNDPNAPANPMLFTGEYRDDTGLYHLRARQYDTGTGRFLGTDPLPPAEDQPLPSTYLYANDRPTVLADPTGMGPFSFGAPSVAANWEVGSSGPLYTCPTGTGRCQPTPPPTAAYTRSLIVYAAWLGWVKNREVHYSRKDPYRMSGVTRRIYPPQVPPYADCSGFVTWTYFVAGAPDPNHLGYNGTGYTGTLADHGRRLGNNASQDLARAKLGDLVFYGRPALVNAHVAVYVGNGITIGHGSEAGPSRLPIDKVRNDRSEIRTYFKDTS